jgi:signal-transduction protein with cAMP-binding, CBS, and nucleotidyltransferase domain
MNPSWELPDLFDVLSKHELLGTLPEAAIKKLIADCREESYGKDWHLYKEGERVNEAFIIMRGGGSEFSDTYKIREKRMLGDVTPIYILAAPSNRYQTSN